MITQQARRRVYLAWRSKSFTASHLPANAEQISINLKAVPSFEAFGRFLETANPFVLWAQMAWFPWLRAASAMLPLSVEPPKLSQKNTEPGM
jgi:hypothetical protein